MSFRAALVDDFKAESTISDLVSTRVFDMFYEFEDLLNRKANAIGNFPAITIESETGETENNLDQHDNLKFETLTITCYQQVHLQKLRSRSQTIRDAQRDILRQVDTLAAAVTDFILDKTGIIGDYYIRASHISSDSDGVFESEGNREIVTREISYVVTYSEVGAVVPIPVNTAIPVVTGDTGEGDTLTTTNGTWTNSPTSYTYRWLRDDIAIPSATSSTYVLTASDLGTTIKSEVTAINAGGSSLPAESVGTAIPSGAIERNFTTLDPALSQYYTLGSTVTLTGDFEIEVDMQTLSTATIILLGKSNNTQGYITVLTSGAIRAKPQGGNAIDTAGGLVNDGKLHKVKVTRVSGLITIIIDGITEATGISIGDMALDRIGTYASGLFFDGIISDVKITDAGTLIHQWNLDEDFGVTSTAVDSVGSNDATVVNVVSGDSENFTFNGAL